MRQTIIPLIGMLLLLPLAALANPDRRTPQPPQPTLQLLPPGTDFQAQPISPLAVDADAQKTTATGSRITTSYQGAGTIAGIYRNKDSAYYTYSGTRGGDLINGIFFDQARIYRWDTIAAAWKPSFFHTGTYDAQNRPTSELIQTWNAINSAFDNNTRLTYIYNAQGKVTMAKTETWNPGTSAWVNYSQYTAFNYNTAGKPVSYLYQIWKLSTSSWGNLQRFTATYNTHGDVTSWLTENWNSATSAYTNMYNEVYSYTATFKPERYYRQMWNAAGSSWKNEIAYNYYYNTSGHDIGYSYQVGDVIGNTWVNKDSLANTSLTSAGKPLTQSTFKWNTVSGSWTPGSRYAMTYNGVGNETSAVRDDWNGTSFINGQRDFSTYNSLGQMISNYGETFNGSIWVIGTGDPTARYGYQPYSTDIRPVTYAGGSLTLYPIPAKHQLNIRVRWAQPASFSIAVYDASGRVVLQSTERASKDYYQLLPVEGLSAGQYIIRIKSDAQSIERIFTVQH